MNAPRHETPFWEQPIETLTREQWEALCDGCGQCCMHKLEDEDDGEVYETNIACRLLDIQSCRCQNYRGRRAIVPDCIRLDRRNLARFDWLPDSCAYKLRARNLPLHDWHYLISGSHETVHEAGVSVRGRAIPETLAGNIEDHVVEKSKQESGS